jgi:hypothetical protein
MKSKNLIIYIGIAVIVLIGLVLFFLLGKKTTAPVAQTPSEEVVTMMKPEEIGLSLTALTDNTKVMFEVANTKNISGIEYSLTYFAKVNNQDVERGANGSIEIKQAGQSVSREITLGTCSDVCHYDEDVSNIKLILKVTKTDGTTSQVEQVLELEQ